MQHDLFKLIDVIMFAKNNFGDNMDDKFAFKRTHFVDGFGATVRHDKVKLDFHFIQAWVKDGDTKIVVHSTMNPDQDDFWIPMLLQEFKDGRVV